MASQQAILRTIAAALERSPSTVSREIARHGGREAYRADAADRAAWSLSRRAKLTLGGRSDRRHEPILHRDAR